MRNAPWVELSAHVLFARGQVFSWHKTEDFGPAAIPAAIGGYNRSALGADAVLRWHYLPVPCSVTAAGVFGVAFISKLTLCWCDDKVQPRGAPCPSREGEMPPLAPVNLKPMFLHHAAEKGPCISLLR